MKGKVKVGLLLDSFEIPAWQCTMLEEVAHSDYASIELLILQGDAPSRGDQKPARFSLYEAFKRYESRKQSIVPNAVELRNADELLANTDRVIRCTGPTDDNTTQQDLLNDEVRSHQLDVIVALGSISLVDTFIDASRCGVWFYAHSFSHTDQTDGSSVGFWEVLKRRPFLNSALMVRSASMDEDRNCYESFSGVNYISHSETRNEHLWKILSFVPRSLRALQTQGWESFIDTGRNVAFDSKSYSSSEIGRFSNSKVLVPLVMYFVWRIARKIVRKTYIERWILMFNLGGDSGDLEEYETLTPPSTNFWADPFVLRKDGCYYIFFEEGPIETDRGHISIIQMDESGKCSLPIKIIERPYHLSYPFVLEWKNDLYVIPESGENKTIEVYKCKQFPRMWEFDRVLMDDVSAYDTTLLDHDGTWWMFTNIKQHDGASSWDELCIFFSDSPLSTEWSPHPMNPVISDVRYAKCAGKIFQEDGILCRPSQNSSYRYGYGFNINQILELTKTKYRERLIRSMEPNWDKSIRALHTYNKVDELALIDVIYRTRNLLVTSNAHHKT